MIARLFAIHFCSNWSTTCVYCSLFPIFVFPFGTNGHRLVCQFIYLQYPDIEIEKVLIFDFCNWKQRKCIWFKYCMSLLRPTWVIYCSGFRQTENTRSKPGLSHSVRTSHSLWLNTVYSLITRLSFLENSNLKIQLNRAFSSSTLL